VRVALAALAVAAVAFFAIAATAAAPTRFLREQRSVSVDGKAEVWQLVWAGRPKSVCGPENVEMAITCPCTGWAYGEIGKLVLQRRQGGKTIDRLALGDYFSDVPADNSEGLAAMQWRPFEPRDMDEVDAGGAALPALLARIKARSGPRAMQLGDYDHDGHATEFLVQVNTGPCGHSEYAAFGVSRATPKLHALGTASRPLIMAGSAWQALLTSGRESRVTVWPCGDHGSDERHELVLSAERGVIRATRRRYNCPEDGSRETLLGSEVL
jgi:hypothetical protein